MNEKGSGAPAAGNAEPNWKDVLVTRTSIVFDWRDRLRVLFGWQPTVRVRTLTLVELGRVLNEGTSTWLEPPQWWPFRHKRLPGAMASNASAPERRPQ